MTNFRSRLMAANINLTIVFFFFKAEDGIRDLTGTGVQTCALPIWAPGAAHPPVGEPPLPAAAGVGDGLCRRGLARTQRGAARCARRHATGVLRRAAAADQELPPHRAGQPGRELLSVDVPGRLPRG